MKNDTIKRMTEPGLLPVIRLDSGDKLPELLEALMRGGVTAAELTMTMPDAPRLLSENKKRFAGALSLGMGTVTDAASARAALEAGAEFLVSPFPVFEALRLAQAACVPMVMGAFSPSEVYQAWKAGADFVKIFPLNVAGIGYLKDIRGPLPGVKLFPTGGITLENVSEVIEAGAVGCGVGGALVKKGLIAAGKWDELAALAKRFVDAVRGARARVASKEDGGK
ncbi:MAG TPA: bifunctional 4-hydroxy-2-oxoglutarate aldolase/2-dehydro-3-deoxy-phosphogluconate aldolase [Opitutales bacterium]|nr:bifunctional 4-hydroxy-2-oxoglutarate aldolase/2-dehydro-3-deoxy-phosphogluconate aldolase [Opitutales bacterium]